MPARTKKQFRFLKAEEARAKAGKHTESGMGLSKLQEFTEGVSYKSLPPSAPKTKRKKRK